MTDADELDLLRMRRCLASMRVVSSHLRKQRVSVGTARGTVMEAANRMASGSAGAETEVLAQHLENATGLTLARLAEHAAQWPADEV